MRPYRTPVVKREGSVSLVERLFNYLKDYGKKCREFYKLTTMLT